MGVEFRQRSVGEFGKMFRRRFWHIILPTIAFSLAVGYVVSNLPSVYRSTTLLTINPPTISDVTNRDQSTDQDVSLRLNGITEKVKSRSSLEPMITKYNLFQRELKVGTPMELLIDKMRKNIDVKMIYDENRKVPSFQITYDDKTPEEARNVTVELASKYVNENAETNGRIADDTAEFYKTRLEEAQKLINDLDAQRLSILTNNINNLPESQVALVSQLDGFRKQQENYISEKNSLNAEKGRLNDNRQGIIRQIQIIDDSAVRDAKVADRLNKQTSSGNGMAQLAQKKAELEAKLATLKLRYKDAMPEVQAAKNEISKLDEQISGIKNDSKDAAADVELQAQQRADSQKKMLAIEKDKIESEMARVESQMKEKDLLYAQSQQQIDAIQARMGGIPGVQVQLEAIKSAYDGAKKNLDQLQENKNKADTTGDIISANKGETIKVVDPASLPEFPVKPNRQLLTAAGTGVGLLIGLLLAAMFEFPRMLTIQNIEDAKHYTGLPVLASVPSLLTPREIKKKRFAYLFRLAVGILAAAGSIPLLILALQMFKIFDKFVS